MSIKVLLVDDHKMLREGIKQLIEFNEDIKVIGQASNGKECMDVLNSIKPDVVVLDINLPDISGLKLIGDIKKKGTKVLVLTLHNEVEYLAEALEKGIDGYILKDSDSEELVKAIRSVYSGERFIQTDLLPNLNSYLLKRDNENNKVNRLTTREIQILVKIALGKSNKDIGEDYDISERTVKNHISNIFKKIEVSDRTQAAVFAIRNNLVSI